VPFEAAGVTALGLKDVMVGGDARDPHPLGVYTSRYPVCELCLNIPLTGNEFLCAVVPEGTIIESDECT